MTTLSPITNSAVTKYDETRKLQTRAAEFVLSQKPHARISIEQQTSEVNFSMILDAHNQQLDIRAVQFLPVLCFPLESSRDRNGLRFVLWKPVIEFLQTEFEVEIEEWLCHGEVALVYLTNEVAEFAKLIFPKIEEGRLRMPFRREGAAFVVAFNSFCEIELELRKKDQLAAEIAERIHHKLSSKMGSAAAAGCTDLAKLAQLAAGSPSWAIENCLEFLQQIKEEAQEATSPFHFASEAALARDWLTEEEDTAWRNL